MSSDTVVKVPISLLVELIGDLQDEDPEVDIVASIKRLASEWACVFKKAAFLRVQSFETREALAEWLEEQYKNDTEIEVILNKGRPRKFQMTVKARIR